MTLKPHCNQILKHYKNPVLFTSTGNCFFPQKREISKNLTANKIYMLMTEMTRNRKPAEWLPGDWV